VTIKNGAAGRRRALDRDWNQPIHRLSISVTDTLAYFVLHHCDEPKPPAAEGGRSDEALPASFV